MSTDQYISLVQRHAELDAYIEAAVEERAEIKHQLEKLGLGSHSVAGLTVKVKGPSRKFNLERAWGLLNPEQRNLSLSPDAAKVKSYLPPVLLDSVMEPGTGKVSVTVS